MHDITSLVLSLALPWDVDHVNPDMDELHAKAQALVAPFVDYEASARAEGWKPYLTGGGHFRAFAHQDGRRVTAHTEALCRTDATWEDVCNAHNIDLVELGTPCQFFIISKERAAELEKDGFLDYEGAARAAGWDVRPDHVNFEHYAGEPSVMHEDPSVNDSSYSVDRWGWKLCCEENGIEPLSTPFRIERDFDGLIVWARP